jgi:hypothetical protein
VNPENSPRTGRDGRFLPGVSGNPGGRPKAIVARIREQTNDGAELVDFLVQVVRDETEPTRVRIEAAGELLDRGFGRAPIAAGVEVSVVAEHSLMGLARRLSAADMEALEARARDFDIDGDVLEG